MDTTPPSVSNSVKLANLTDPNINAKAYQEGYISLPFVEPSLGIPTGNTLTEEGSAYYFPIFGISNNYFLSRKFTGNDSLILRNKRLGINTPNPQFSVDVTGTVRATNATLITLSAVNIVPSSGDSINISAPGNIAFNSNVNITGQTTLANLTAANLLTTNFNAVCAQFTNVIINTIVLTGAQINNNISITGNVSATNARVLSSITTNTLLANTISTNLLSAIVTTVTNSLSVQKDIYATNIFGKIQLDPTSPFSYNGNNQLTFNRNINYSVAVKPSDPFSTDDPAIPRTTTGQFSAVDKSLPWTQPTFEGWLKPFFKTVQGALNYATVNGLVGNGYNVFIIENIVEGERKPNNGTTPTDESGKYHGLYSIAGNLSAAFYSTEWLQLSAPALYNAGLRGGHYIWPIDKTAPAQGIYHTTNIENFNFNNINLYGLTEIGTKISNNAYVYYTTWAVFNEPPRTISYRSYICSNPALPTGTFGTDVSAWTTLKTEAFAFNRPFVINHLPGTTVRTINLAFEFDSNAFDSTAYQIQKGSVEVINTSVAVLGNAMYTYGAVNTYDRNSFLYVRGGFSLDPYYLTPSTWNTWNNTPYGLPLWGSTGQIFPGWGFAIIGNPPGKKPTNISYAGTKDTGIFRITDGSSVRIIDYGGARNIGRWTQHLSSIIFDGQFNTPSVFYYSNNSSSTIVDSFFKTNSFALSSKNVNLNNTGVNPTYIAEYFDAVSPADKINMQHLRFDGSFITASIILQPFRVWTFSPTAPLNDDNTVKNMFSINNGAATPNYVYVDSETVNLSGSVFTLGSLNQLLGYDARANQIINNQIIKVTTPNNLKNYNTDGFFRLTSPNNAQVYTLAYYASGTR
jgi:hypothetical protein